MHSLEDAALVDDSCERRFQSDVPLLVLIATLNQSDKILARDGRIAAL